MKQNETYDGERERGFMSGRFVERLSQEESERFRRWIHVAKRRLGVTFRLVAAGTGVARNSLLWYANQPEAGAGGCGAAGAWFF